jgi:uncharacterized protein RhaS with RHS repeats
LQTDPVGYEDDVNLYAYVRNDPLNHTDPTGQALLAIPVAAEACAASGACAAAVAAGVVVVGTLIAESADEIAEVAEVIADTISDVHESIVTSIVDQFERIENSMAATEHTKNARPSTKEKHEQGQARRDRDRGGEKGDARRGPPRKRPPGHKGPWPPKQSPAASGRDNRTERSGTEEPGRPCVAEPNGKSKC